jgi:hypothetical protein
MGELGRIINNDSQPTLHTSNAPTATFQNQGVGADARPAAKSSAE